jgi:antibiotic biosynthesis monooxygenase (ABM) superfamily enzyme
MLRRRAQGAAHGTGTSIWHKAVKLRWDSMETLNAWLAEECRAAWAELNHPEWPR